ncbi:helix-turn-helix transcriptional regulator [Yersinia hibernica]|uniref:Helix-turn-helix transcriptional regulator n=1 Tax=Yersinia enterocolitica LC20 TaxID=1443113 RepID=A0A7U4K3A0_YEREN|nr:PAS and helix-turn-helix domain-containing protein [Yersinia hibernica]AHM76485.1 helix-turn-helix transcriptional regulator [Yersinia hibernica]OVZ79944.1 helix-turn-helix transcriptional regulator [Yersinia kristensenii]
MDKNLLKQIEVLIRFWGGSSEPWGVKDNQSRFVYANRRVNKLFNISDQYCLEGRLDGEIPTPAAEFQKEFQAHDRKVELLQDRVTSVDIQLYDGHSYFTPYFCDKYPLIDENGISQGIIFHSRPVTDTILSRLSKIKIPTTLIFTPPSDLFSKREWEVLFYILHSFSSAEISKKLHLSPRTVDNIIQSIYRKSDVSNKRQMIDYCYENKINNYVPQSFFECSGSFPLV